MIENEDEYNQLEESYFNLKQEYSSFIKNEYEPLKKKLKEKEEELRRAFSMLKSEQQFKQMYADLQQEEHLAKVNLEIRNSELEVLVKDLERANEGLRFSEYNNLNLNPITAQANKNIKELIPRYSTSLPMEVLTFAAPTTDIVLTVSDRMHFGKYFDPKDYRDRYHVLGTFGNEVFRFAKDSAFAEKPEDFAVIVSQMTSELKNQIYKKYVEDKRSLCLQ